VSGRDQTEATPIMAALSWASVSVGGRAASVYGASHTLALTKDGRVYASGDNLYGQLGVQAFVTTPKRIVDP
jgi:alpha-tubulin suppressor-like RCC1 family protein